MEANLEVFKKPAPETLYGQITVNGNSKIGSFRRRYNINSGRIEYLYYTEKGYRGTGGFTTSKALYLYSIGNLSIDPAMGKSESYV